MHTANSEQLPDDIQHMLSSAGSAHQRHGSARQDVGPRSKKYSTWPNPQPPPPPFQQPHGRPPQPPHPPPSRTPPVHPFMPTPQRSSTAPRPENTVKPASSRPGSMMHGGATPPAVEHASTLNGMPPLQGRVCTWFYVHQCSCSLGMADMYGRCGKAAAQLQYCNSLNMCELK